ncbi:chromosome segregation protein SMC [Candidatus Sumerlaeota bacterium]|nr:chromosome segregation protein SMC [Candidatus Sumerlaeota bacterium]
MYIKKLILNGFKSFPVKKTLDLSPGITVIVGPNGCGKSNVFDAMRWVLGEGNARKLRGDRMGDLMFQGSRTHKQQSLASVSLLIDNKDRQLPLDFTEIMITRKIYRQGDGEFLSEYEINGAACLRKDVVDLFMDTGIGKSAYSIMEQDKVKQLIDSKPKERRIVFDEAAGVSRYRVKREATLRKLEQTEAELVRHHDIMSTRETELRRLKRQAGKAERYKKIQAEIVQLEAHSLIEDYRRTQEQSKEADQQVTVLQSRLEARQAQLASLEASHEEYGLKQLEWEERIAELNRKQYEMRSELQALEGRIQVYQERQTSNASQLEAARRTLETARKELDDRQGDQEDLTTELSAQRNKLIEVEAAYEERKAIYERLKNEQAAIRERLNALRIQARETGQEVLRLENEQRIVEMRIDQSQEFSQETAEGISELERRITEGEASLNSQREELNQKQESVQRLREQLARLNEDRRQVRDECQSNLRQLEERRSEISQLNTRYETFKKLEESYQGFHRGVKEVMLASEQQKLNNIHGVLAQLIQIDAEHEKAIEQALGGHLQDIVTETSESARDAITYLKQNQLGRATFLPLDLIEVQRTHLNILSAVTRPGVVNIASKLVQCDGRTQPAVDFLLGSILVVEDLQTAENLLRSGLKTRYVTLDGDTLSERGMMSGGHIQNSGLLTREREIRELSEKIEQARQAETELAASLAQAQSRATEIEKAIEAAKEDSHRDEVAAEQQRNKLESDKRALEDAQRQLEALRAKREKLNNEMDRDRNRILEIAAAIEQARVKQSEADRDVELMESDSQQDDEGNAQSIHDAYSEAYGILTETRERVSNMEERLKTLNTLVAQLSSDIQRRENEIREKEEQGARLEKQLTVARNDRDAMKTSTVEFERALEEEQRKRQECEQQARELENQRQIAMREERQAENELTEARMKQNEMTMRLQTLDQRALEKFNTPLQQLVQSEETVELTPDEINIRLAELRERKESLGEINPGAIDEYEEVRAQHEEYLRQVQDLEAARESLIKTIKKIDKTSRELFIEAFEIIRGNFNEIFRQLFGGGKADLILTDPNDVLNSGVDIMAMPPGSQVKNIMLQSGGEKSMVAVALLFAIFKYKPSPFCVLDEIDHALDDANVERFKSMIAEFSAQTQFVMITHNKLSMELADTIYGVTMEEKGVTEIVSVQFTDMELAS